MLMTKEQKTYEGYPKFEMEHGSVVAVANVDTHRVSVYSQVLMRRLSTPNQKVGTTGWYSFNRQGEYEGIGDVSGEPGPECPQVLLDEMDKIEKILQENW